MAAKRFLLAVTLFANCNDAFGFSIIIASSLCRTERWIPVNGHSSNRQFLLRRGFQAAKMTLDSTVTKGDKDQNKVLPAQSSEPNLCDINSQLCDGDIHTAPLDLDIKTSTEPAKQNLMEKVKATGIAGLISYAAWEFVFWAVSVPMAIIIYHQTAGEWPSFSNAESTAKVSAVIFGFLNFARALVPVRIGLTLATVPLVDAYIVKPFGLGKAKSDAAVPSDTPPQS